MYKTLNQELEENQQKQAKYAINYLDISDKQSIEHFLYYVQIGRVSCSKAADKIIEKINKEYGDMVKLADTSDSKSDGN